MSMMSMKQSSLDLSLSVRKTRKREFFAEMAAVVPWAALVELIAPCYPKGRNGRPPFCLGDDAQGALHAAMVCLVEPGHARGFL